MNRFQREMYRKHNQVYKEHDADLKQIRDEFEFKTKANKVFAGSYKSDEKCKSQLITT